MDSDNIILQLEYKSPTRLKSWISMEQIEVESWEVIDKICKILFSNKYSEECVSYARKILEFLNDWGYITWKQYDSIMSINEIGKYSGTLMIRDKTRIKEGEYYINVASKRLNFTIVNHENPLVINQLKNVRSDRDIDRFYKSIFGYDPTFEENLEGYVTLYRDNGERIFTLPTDDD